MMLVPIVVLASVIGLTPVPQKEALNAASSLWQIFFRVHVEGDFRSADGDQVASVVTDDQGFGSGVMVSPDGDLLTAQHVLDPYEIARDACVLGLQKVYTGGIIARSMRVDYRVRNIVDDIVYGRVYILPQAPSESICGDPRAIVWKNDEAFGMQVVKVDTVADLALAKLQVKDAPFVPVATPTIAEHDPLYALGWVEKDTFIRATGTFVRWCELVADIQEGDGELIKGHTELLMRFQVPVKAGMSGGPIMSGGALAGIATIHADFDTTVTGPDGKTTTVSTPGGYGIPAAYVHAWYLWAIGKADTRPATVCENPYVPSPESGTGLFNPFGRRGGHPRRP